MNLKTFSFVLGRMSALILTDRVGQLVWHTLVECALQIANVQW